jgi:hypothetical protein
MSADSSWRERIPPILAKARTDATGATADLVALLRLADGAHDAEGVRACAYALRVLLDEATWLGTCGEVLERYGFHALVWLTLGMAEEQKGARSEAFERYLSVLGTEGIDGDPELLELALRGIRRLLRLGR